MNKRSELFNVVLGCGRGHSINDSLLSTTPSAVAHTRLQELWRELCDDRSGATLERAVNLLAANYQLVDDKHPLLLALAGRVSACYLGRTLGSHKAKFLSVLNAFEIPGSGFETFDITASALGRETKTLMRSCAENAGDLDERLRAQAVEIVTQKFVDTAGLVLASIIKAGPDDVMNRVLELGAATQPRYSTKRLRRYLPLMGAPECKQLIWAATKKLLEDDTISSEDRKRIAPLVCSLLMQLGVEAETRAKECENRSQRRRILNR